MKELNISLSPQDAGSDEALKKNILRSLGKDSNTFSSYRIVRRSIDARGHNVCINLKVEVFFKGENLPSSMPVFKFQNARTHKSVVIVGAGPAGLFAALQLIESGMKPVIIERGKKVRERRRDIAALNKEHLVNPDSNYCFGEGGAGTYSDGKLYTRSTKRGDVRKVLQLLVHHGAPEEILIDAHPHIGTNKLPQLIEKIRETILNNGGEFHFETRLTDLVVEKNQVCSIITQSVIDGSEKEFLAENLILATGHSARDIFELLHRKNILIEAKPFAMGVRAEHSQELIDAIQYHCRNREEVRGFRKFLPAASYSLVDQVNGTGVYSFCMCPGGIIAPCATAPSEIVVNGWSPSRRNNPYANSGIVTSIEEHDIDEFFAAPETSSELKELRSGLPTSLVGLYFQKALEQMAFVAGGESQVAPAQRLIDFVEGKFSSTLPSSSYQPGIKSAPLHELLPKTISTRLRQGFSSFGKKMRGYYTNEAVLHGVESRTSSPVRIPRKRETMEHAQVKGLYPVGEGAGYAGGIVSAAIDGMNAAQMILRKTGVEVN